jgi:ferritin-like metal-binding protein YciE
MDKNKNSLEDLFLMEVKDLYNAEKQLTKVLPKAANKASSSDLKSAIENHLHQTEGHVNRLEQVFKILGQPTKGRACPAMKGILEEADGILGQKAEGSVRDAGIIGAVQKVEHYEIASYGTIVQWAEQMGREDIKQLLGQTLNEAKETDQKLTELAKTHINVEASDSK